MYVSQVVIRCWLRRFNLPALRRHTTWYDLIFSWLSRTAACIRSLLSHGEDTPRPMLRGSEWDSEDQQSGHYSVREKVTRWCYSKRLMINLNTVNLIEYLQPDPMSNNLDEKNEMKWHDLRIMMRRRCILYPFAKLGEHLEKTAPSSHGFYCKQLVSIRHHVVWWNIPKFG